MNRSMKELLVMTVLLQLINAREINSSRFVFIRGSNEAEKCVANTFCEKVPQYPRVHIESAIRNNQERYQAFFGDDVLESQKSAIGNRNAFMPEEHTLCESEVMIKYPLSAENREGSWNYIVNEQNYTQGIRVEICLTPNITCLYSESFPNGKHAVCEQKYNYRYLLAINERGEVFKGAFKLPAYCQCTVHPKSLITKYAFRK